MAKSMLEELRRACVDAAPAGLLSGWRLAYVEETCSTMDVARALTQDPAKAAELGAVDLGSGLGTNYVVLAHAQTAGRGRQGRPWVSAPGCGIYATFGWAPVSLSSLQGLSLAAGLAVHRAVRALGGDAALKWPNDVVVWRPEGMRKLGGILVDVQSKGQGTETVLIGIGLNLFRQQFPVDVPGIALEELFGAAPDYTLTFARLTAEVVQMLREFSSGGFSGLCEEWNAASGMSGRTGEASINGNSVRGRVIKVLEDGALFFHGEGEAEPRKIYSAELTFVA
ncbi:MAG: biotin--[acetyl-CoA-carboxylase] ligase [Bdellovibrionota bacterium]